MSQQENFKKLVSDFEAKLRVAFEKAAKKIVRDTRDQARKAFK